MAYSGNANQCRKVGPHFGIDLTTEPRHRALLRYWFTANGYAARACDRYLPTQTLFVRFEDLCGEPLATLRRIGRFLELTPAEGALRAIAKTISPPPTIGRYRQYQTAGAFSETELQAIRRLGFPVADAVEADSGGTEEPWLDGMPSLERWLAKNDLPH